MTVPCAKLLCLKYVEVNGGFHSRIHLDALKLANFSPHYIYHCCYWPLSEPNLAQTHLKSFFYSGIAVIIRMNVCVLHKLLMIFTVVIIMQPQAYTVYAMCSVTLYQDLVKHRSL